MQYLPFALALFSSIGIFAQTYPRTELSLHVGNYDKSIPFNNIYVEDPALAPAQNYSDRSFSFGVLTKFHRNPLAAFRIKLMYANKQVTGANETNLGQNKINESFFRQQFLRVSPGFQWRLQQNRTEFFAGVELPLTYIGNTTNLIREHTTNFGTGQTSTTSHEVFIPGGFGVAMGLFIGSAFQLNEYLIFGIEINNYCGYNVSGGYSSTLSKFQPIQGPVTSIYDHYERKIKQIGFSSFSGMITLGVVF